MCNSKHDDPVSQIGVTCSRCNTIYNWSQGFMVRVRVGHGRRKPARRKRSPPAATVVGPTSGNSADAMPAGRSAAASRSKNPTTACKRQL